MHKYSRKYQENTDLKKDFDEINGTSVMEAKDQTKIGLLVEAAMTKNLQVLQNTFKCLFGDKDNEEAVKDLITVLACRNKNGDKQGITHLAYVLRVLWASESTEEINLKLKGVYIQTFSWVYCSHGGINDRSKAMLDFLASCIGTKMEDIIQGMHTMINQM